MTWAALLIESPPSEGLWLDGGSVGAGNPSVHHTVPIHARADGDSLLAACAPYTRLKNSGLLKFTTDLLADDRDCVIQIHVF
jgi:hypothetical protein